MDIDLSYWRDQLQHPDWYLRLKQELDRYIFPLIHDDFELKSVQTTIYSLVQTMLASGEIPLAITGPDLDQHRQSIDSVIIHHTEEDPNLSPQSISAIGLLRLYAPKFIANNVAGYALGGKPIWSGHFYQDQQVFFGYHWLVYPDGKSVQILPDTAVGWHSGEWEINCRSVGIALAGNYEHSSPPPAQINAVAKIIQVQYSHVKTENILGHNEVKTGRTCPGEYFLDGWKNQLLQQIVDLDELYIDVSS